MTNLSVFTPASMSVCSNPLVAPLSGLPAAIGAPLRDLAPVTGSPLMLRLNGEWRLRADWSRPVCPGDVIEWHVLPMGGNASRQILTIVALVAIAYFTMGAGAGFFGAAGSWTAIAAQGLLTVGAMALINALVPIQQPSMGTTQSPGSVYNVATSGNQARLYQPIPVIYGRMLTFPDYAAQPYAEYSSNEQFFYAIYCIGQGSYTVEQLQIDDTPLANFQDVNFEVLAPAVAPTLALANVVTAPEVSGQTMKTDLRIGGFAACAPKFAAASIGIDVVFPRGLGIADSSGTIGNASATFIVAARPIDDFGVPTNVWITLGTETITAGTSTPQRVTRKYLLATPRRVEVCVLRTDTINTSINALHEMVWAGLRAYLTVPAPLCATATHLALRIRASDQLSGLSQRKINGIWRRRLRTWAAGVWGPEVETRNPMWARLDKLTNAVYGDGLADSRIDLQTHATLAAVCDARQDRLDIVFDSKVTSIDADRTICMTARAVPFQRAGVCTVTRDQLQTLPVTAFTSRNMLPGSMSIRYALATEVTADAVIVEYFNNRSWDWREIQCNAPGVTAPVNAVRQRIMGITGAKHAEREGLYLAAQNVYRRKFPKFSTEMQGLLPAYGSAVVFAPALPGWGQSGDVAFWDVTTLTMGCTEPLTFTTGAQHYISLLRDNGSITDAIAVTPGPTANDVVLAAAPDFTLVLDDGSRERPKYVFGASGQHRIIARVLGISKKGRGKDGAPTIEISTVAEDVRVHAVDNTLLPGPGETQDSVTSAYGSRPIVHLVDQVITATNLIGTATASYMLTNLGAAYGTSNSPAGTAIYPNQWMASGLVERSVAALYEVRFTYIAGDTYTMAPTAGDAMGVWLNLGTTRLFMLSKAPSSKATATCKVRVEIRAVGSAIYEDSRYITLSCTTAVITDPAYTAPIDSGAGIGVGPDSTGGFNATTTAAAAEQAAIADQQAQQTAEASIAAAASLAATMAQAIQALVDIAAANAAAAAAANLAAIAQQNQQADEEAAAAAVAAPAADGDGADAPAGDAPGE